MSKILPIGVLAVAVCAGQVGVPGNTKVPGGTAAVSGSVLDESRKPVARALVAITADIPQAGRGVKAEPFVPFRSLAVTGTDGAYRATGLPKGYFRICVQLPGSDFVEECLWTGKAADTTLSEGEEAKLPAITVKRGHPLQIRVDDPGQVLPRGNALPTPQGLSVGVFPKGRPPVFARRKGSDEAGFDYEVLVPYGREMDVAVASKVLNLTDGNGKAADAVRGVLIPIMVSESSKPKTPVKAVVTGVKR